MQHATTCNPTALCERASAHRAMAVAALRADSSLPVRLKRYNHHMNMARALEGGAAEQQATSRRELLQGGEA